MEIEDSGTAISGGHCGIESSSSGGLGRGAERAGRRRDAAVCRQDAGNTPSVAGEFSARPASQPTLTKKASSHLHYDVTGLRCHLEFKLMPRVCLLTVSSSAPGVRTSQTHKRHSVDSNSSLFAPFYQASCADQRIGQRQASGRFSVSPLFTPTACLTFGGTAPWLGGSASL